jgi:hypothetical protein
MVAKLQQKVRDEETTNAELRARLARLEASVAKSGSAKR